MGFKRPRLFSFRLVPSLELVMSSIFSIYDDRAPLLQNSWPAPKHWPRNNSAVAMPWLLKRIQDWNICFQEGYHLPSVPISQKQQEWIFSDFVSCLEATSYKQSLKKIECIPTKLYQGEGSPSVDYEKSDQKVNQRFVLKLSFYIV